MFGADEMYNESYYSALRTGYLERANGSVMDALKTKKTLPYTQAWRLAMNVPLVWERDLKDWINDRTLVLVTHRLPILALVDRVIVIEGGKISMDGPRDAIMHKLGHPMPASPATGKKGE